MGMHLIGIHLIGVYIMGVHHRKQPVLLTRTYIFAAFGLIPHFSLALSGNLALGFLFRVVMGDGEERTEGIFCSVIVYEKLCRKPKPPQPELCGVRVSTLYSITTTF